MEKRIYNLAPNKNSHTLAFSNFKQGGFTLVETLVAISILLISIVGPLTIASKGLLSARFARDQITAFYLAQEATELIRNKRDNNAIAGVSWTTGFSQCIGAGKSCIVDATKDVQNTSQVLGVGSIIACQVNCPELRYGTDNLYGYVPSYSASKFTRTISMLMANGISTEILMTVTISWSNGPISKTFSIQENLNDWQ